MRRRRVFVIGAGVSASCGIPVSKDFFSEMMKEWIEHAPDEVRMVHNLIEYLYPQFSSEDPIYPNIEQFFNQVEMAKRFNSEDYIKSTMWSVKRLERIRLLTLTAVSNFIAYRLAVQEGSSERHIRAFVGRHIQPSDTIISFNWDDIVERALSNQRSLGTVTANYERKTFDRKQVVLLKPHGSVSWRNKVAAFPADSIQWGAWLEDSPPLIVPPVAHKEFSLPLFERIWRDVYYALSEATHLWIIGYSMPIEDQFARFVFRRAIRNNIVQSKNRSKGRLRTVVVNPDHKLETHFSQLLGGSFKFLPWKFERFAEKARVDDT